MPDRRDTNSPPRPPTIEFHPDASPEFRSAIIEAYREVPPILRHRLQAYAGGATVIRTVAHPFPIPDVGRAWAGLSISPAFQRARPATLPLESRSLTRFGRHELAVAELLSDGTPGSIRYRAMTLHHEIGHRIDFAISGDNHLNGRTRGILFSQSSAFLEAIQQDLYDAGWRPGQPPPPGFRVSSDLLPQADATGRLNWSAAAREIFADLYARRFSTTLDDQSYLSEGRQTDFSIFRRAGRLVDQAVATFAGRSVMPINPNPGDYPPGREPTPLQGPHFLQTVESLFTGTRHFQPVLPNTPHPPRP